MRIQLWSVGKPHEPQLKGAIDDFTKRISHYYPVEWKLFPAGVSKNVAPAQVKTQEGQKILQSLPGHAVLVALDEHGKQMSSPGLAGYLQQKSNESCRDLVFLIGGAFGLDDAVLARAAITWSLSKLVFPHQIVRLILSEQIYRACTILRNEKYHHA